MLYSIHTNKGWWSGTGFTDYWLGAQKLADYEEQKRKSHRMVEEGLEAKVIRADRKTMEAMALHHAANGKRS